MESKWGNAPMEPNGYPSDDAGSFGCRKLLGLEDQPKEKGQKVMDGEGLKRRRRRGVSEVRKEERREEEKEEWRRWIS